MEPIREPDPAAHDMNRLAAFLEGRLPGIERDEMLAHLSECVECRSTVAAFTKAGGRDAVEEREQAPPDRRPRAAPAWLPVAAVLAVATAATLTLIQQRVVAPPPPGATSPEPSAAAPPPRPLATASALPGVGSGTDPGLLRRRGGATRVVAGKTFRPVPGGWVDLAYDPGLGLPVRDVGPAEREALLRERPALRPYAALGPSLTVVFEGTVYRFHSSSR